MARAFLTIEDKTFDILFFKYSFYREVDTIGIPISRYSGGDIIVDIEGKEDTYLLEKLLDKDRTPVQGKIEVVKGEDNIPVRKIEFEKAYIYSFTERYKTYHFTPPLQRIIISPMRLDINKWLRIDRRWQKSLGFWEKYIPPQEEKSKQEQEEIYVKYVEGKSSATAGDEITYTVKEYTSNNVSDDDRHNVRWAMEVDKVQSKLSGNGETMNIKIKPEWQGKEIIVMPYLHDPTERVSVKTKVEQWILPKPFARSQNLAGQDKDGKIVEDMLYRDKTADDILQIDPLFYRELEESDTSLFIKMGTLMFLGTLGDGFFNNLGLVDHFQFNTGNVFSSDYMNQALANHPSFKEFVYKDNGIIKVLKQELRKCNGNVNKIEFVQDKRIDWSKHPVFDKTTDYLNGMILAVDNISGFMVHIDKYELLSVNTFNATLRIDIWDNFGLDKDDVQKFIFLAGFRAWYVLQHVRGYKPFITNMTCNIEVKNESF